MSSFRPIRPSSSHDIKDETTPPPTRENTRQSGVAESSVSVGKGRKRKAPAHVSQNACTNCKKARAKCDGAEGSPCTRCISRGIADLCQYELHVKTAKEELIRKIRLLEQANAELNVSIKEKDRWIETVVDLLMKDGKGVEALEQIKEPGQSYQILIDALARPPLEQHRHNSGSSIDSTLFGSDYSMEYDDDGGQRWTSVTTDSTLVHHLMALYFSWVHPVHMLFSERHFMSSFRKKDFSYCSPSLVNAMCAMGCYYFVDENGNDIIPRRLGERFTFQVRAETKTEDRMTPVSAVTYAILFLVELSAGQAHRASSHLRLAVDSLRDVDRSVWSDEAFEITSFGIHTLNTAWAAFTYQKPAAPISSNIIVFENVELDRPNAYWQLYRFPEDAANRETQSYAIEITKESAKLSQIECQTINEWCGSRGKVTARGILELYRRYLTWKAALPDHLTRLEVAAEDTHEALPHVFSLHISYCVAICQLFTPLLECKQLSAMARDHIKQLALQSAFEGLDLYQRYRSLFSNRYQPPLQAFYLVHLCDLILRQEKSDIEKIIRFCLETLGEALPGFPMIAPLQAMFCESVISCGHHLPADVEQFMGGRNWQSYSREDKLECCERLTYAQPVDLLIERLDPQFAQQFEDEWKIFIEKHGKVGEDDQDDNLLASNSAGDDDEQRTSARAGSERKSIFEPHAMDINAVMNP